MHDDTAPDSRFETHRDHLRAVGYRMLGSTAEADDAVQETWLRFSRTDTAEVENLGGWLTTVVSRICLDMLRSRQARREEPMDADRPEPAAARDPEHEAILADAVGDAMTVVLDTLSPPERLAFVLHDTFGVPFEEIAAIVDRSPAATRQLASRARRRVQGVEPVPSEDLERQREVVGAFLDAARHGRFEALLALLDPDIVVRADRVAKAFSGAARAARQVVFEGVPAAAWMQGRAPRVVFAFTVEAGRIMAIDLIADPEHLDAVEAGQPGRR